MRHVEKAGVPGVLAGDGAAFQDAALEFALTGGSANAAVLADLQKHASIVNDPNGQRFGHYASALFAKYNYYSNPAVKGQLIVDHAGKCAFCESFIMTTDVGDVEHFRPKAAVTVRDRNDPNHEVNEDRHPGYFWLSADWDNLFLSCKQCNQAYKRNFFDVWPDSARATPNARNTAEAPMLLCPALADAELRRLIRFNPATAEALPNPIALFGDLANRAVDLPIIGRSIEIVGLNRPRLLEARANHLVKIRALFVLVANGGALPPRRPLPRVSDAQPAILDFLVRPNSAAEDAKAALQRAIAPTAEYSALVIDALLVWSGALEFQAELAQVSLQQDNQVRLQIGVQRLNAEIALAERYRGANARSSAREAEPDTAALDQEYNELLGRYKRETASLGPQSQALTQRRLRVNGLEQQHELARQQSGLAQREDRYQTLEGERVWLLRAAGGDPVRAASQLRFQQVQQEIGFIEAWMRGEGQQIVANANARREAIDREEEPLADAWNTLQEINEDLVGLTEAYRRIGANRAARVVRCEELEAALASALDWLDTGAAPNAGVQQHLIRRGYPPAIRK